MERLGLKDYFSLENLTHRCQFLEEELELLSFFDHPLCSLLPLISIFKGDSFLHHCFQVLYNHPAQSLIGHLLVITQKVQLVRAQKADNASWKGEFSTSIG